VVYLGGMLGVGLMRLAGYGIMKILDRFPRLETSAYVMVAIIGVKMLVEWWLGGAVAAHSPFNDLQSPLCWGFWAAMVLTLAAALLPAKRRRAV
jgi:predicted tellurium resistance membrane protein TerC